MKPPGQVIDVHTIQGRQSCTSWAIEFILKLYEEMDLFDYTLQKSHPDGIGFGDVATRLLDAKGITAWDETLELADFEQISKQDALDGRPLIFAFPTSVNLNFQNSYFDGFNCHRAIAVHSSNPDVGYVTRIFQKPEVFGISLTPFYTFLRTKIQPDYIIHCLRHKPKNSP